MDSSPQTLGEKLRQARREVRALRKSKNLRQLLQQARAAREPDRRRQAE